MKDKFKELDNLIEAALEEFSINQYDNASLNNILKKSNISKGSFYYHFNSKKNLYLFLLDKIKKTKLSYINAYILKNNIDVSKLTFFEILRLQANAGVLFAKDYPKYNSLGEKVLKEDSKSIIDELNHYKLVSYKDYLKPLIQKALDNKEIRESFSLDFTVKLISNIFTNYSLILFEDFKLDLDKVTSQIDTFIDFIEYGLKAR